MTRNVVGTGSDTVSGRIPRLRLKPERQEANPRPGGHVDGGWWPRTADLSAELPGLLTVLSARLGPIERVVYDVSGWVPQPRRLPFHGRSIRLDGYPFHRTGTLYSHRRQRQPGRFTLGPAGYRSRPRPRRLGDCSAALE